MKLFLLVTFLFSSFFLHAQADIFCYEKSSQNSYTAGNDTSLSLYKTIAQTGNTKILLFKIKAAADNRTIPVIAKTDVVGEILWAKAFGQFFGGYNIASFDAITINDNKIFVFCIAQSSTDPQSPWVSYCFLLNNNGNLLQQNSYAIINNPLLPANLPTSIKLRETPQGNVLFLCGYNQQAGDKGIALAGSIDMSGNIMWSSILEASENNYSIIDLVCYNESLIIQGLSAQPFYPYSAILNSTKLSLSNGNLIKSSSIRDYSDYSYGGGLGTSVLVDNFLLKTLVSWRTPYHYQIYFSFTQDTSLNLLQGTTFYTSTNALSYIPSSATLDQHGNGLIKSYGGTDRTNIGYFITDINDNIIQEKKINNFPPFSNYISTPGNAEVSFDNADSVYLYWNGKKSGKDIVGWIKSGVNTTGDFCAVKDSSFIEKENYPMQIYDWKLNKLADNALEPVSFPVTIFSPTIRKELICEKIYGFCNPIKIRPKDTICNTSQPIRITVYKNPECHSKIFFNFDTTAVTNWQQPDDTTLLLSFSKNWQGKIYATSSFCPSVKDSISLVVYAPKLPINLGKDNFLCNGDSIRLSAGQHFKTYQWQDGNTDSFFIAKESGKYYVEAMDSCGRIYTDTINLTQVNKKLNLGSDVSICTKESIHLTANNGFVIYSWNPWYNISNPTTPVVTVNPEITTAYNVEAITAEGCILKDTIVVQVEDCPQEIFFPSGFTPNNDGKNDFFKPVSTAPLEKYEFSIYNRWGQRVFYSLDKSKGWDGKINGAEQNGDSFIWMCTYKFYNQPVTFRKGTFLLIR